MKPILLPVALAILAADARADHSGNFFVKFGRFAFGFGRPAVCAPFVPCAPAGHYEFRDRRVFVPGCSENVWVEPVFQSRVFGCRTFRFCVRPGYYRRVWHDGYYRVERFRVLVPGPVACG
ncbi:MAG TPA: hypothetical protein VFI25_10935 [Planctomycetota bacterium]|jgi:hypothetical protein|nr:hypothetical protein [Planctomycetota bacterium]